MSLFNYPPNSPLLITLTAVFAITSAITVLDKRLIQARRTGALPPDEPMLPSWVGVLLWAHWGLGLTILLLNWKYALAVFVLKFILSVLPVLEVVGNIIMRPFRPRQ